MAKRKKNNHLPNRTDRKNVGNLSLAIGLTFLGGFIGFRIAFFQMLGDIDKILNAGNLIFLFAVIFLAIYFIYAKPKKHE